jgi:hypothetical protein
MEPPVSEEGGSRNCLNGVQYFMGTNMSSKHNPMAEKKLTNQASDVTHCCSVRTKKPAFKETEQLHVRLQVLNAASTNTSAVWYIVACCFVGVDRRFKDAYLLHHQGGDGGSTHP